MLQEKIAWWDFHITSFFDIFCGLGLAAFLRPLSCYPCWLPSLRPASATGNLQIQALLVRKSCYLKMYLDIALYTMLGAFYVLVLLLTAKIRSQAIDQRYVIGSFQVVFHTIPVRDDHQVSSAWTRILGFFVQFGRFGCCSHVIHPMILVDFFGDSFALTFRRIPMARFPKSRLGH